MSLSRKSNPSLESRFNSAILSFARPSSPRYTSCSVLVQKASRSVEEGEDEPCASSPKPRLPTIPHQTSSTTNSSSPGAGAALHLSRKGVSRGAGSQQPFARESEDS